VAATLKQIIEALLFASQKPLMPKEIGTVLRSASTSEEDLEAATHARTGEAQIVLVLEELRNEYEQLDRAFQLLEQVNGWYVVTKPDTAKWVRHLYPESKPARLSGPALETLAIIAYRQPITKADIEAVRGVAVDGVVQALLERGLIKIHGRAEVPGRPLLYATSEYFLEHFGLKSLNELPNTAELRRVNLPTAKKEQNASAENLAGEAASSTEDEPSQPTDHRVSNESPEPDFESGDQEQIDTNESPGIPEDREIIEEEVDTSEQSPQPDEPDTEDSDRVAG
jgi:segregation and condensation protein B